MSLSFLTLALVRRAEKRVGVTFDYVRHIARTSTPLLIRYNRVFAMIDPRHHLPPEVYHAARIRAAVASDCGTCVEAETNLARNSGLSDDLIDAILSGISSDPTLKATISFTDATIADRSDAAQDREILRQALGEKGLIELALAMNGAAFLPGVKRALGFATTCNIEVHRKTTKKIVPDGRANSGKE